MNFYGQMKKKTHKSKIEKRDADVSIQGSRALWMFDEYENDVNHMLRPLQSPNLNPVGQLWGISAHWLRQPPALSWCFRTYITSCLFTVFIRTT